MSPHERFTGAVAALPGPVREWLDVGTPLGWSVLGDAATGDAVYKAARRHQRLPHEVEVLVERLIREVGIMPADVAASAEAGRSSSAWVHAVAVEPEGQSYRIRNTISGEIHTPVRPDAVAGYATLALELAATAFDAVEQWIDAGERFQAADVAPSYLKNCAIEMCANLRSAPPSRAETDARRGTLARLADTLERTWNDQSLEARSALSAVRLSTAGGAHAPAENHYAPMSGHRLRAYSLGEMRWLRALAGRAVATAPRVERKEAPLLRIVGSEIVESDEIAAKDPALTSLEVLEARIRADIEQTGTIGLGSDAGSLTLDGELGELTRTARGLSGAVKRHLGNSYGIDLAQTLARLADSDLTEAVHAEIAESARRKTLPAWLKTLAAALLTDAGAQTTDGTRTAAMRLEANERPEGGYTAVEPETGTVGHLTLPGLVEQTRLGLSFAQDVWTGLRLFRNIGREGTWTIAEAETGSRKLEAGERETLDAARRIDRILKGAQRAYSRAHGQAPSTMEQASLLVGVLAEIGPEIRAAAGWTDAAGTPNPRDPKDTSRIVEAAKALEKEVRAISNSFIAGGITDPWPQREPEGNEGAAERNARSAGES